MVSSAQAKASEHFGNFIERIAEGDVTVPPYPATAARLAELIASDKHTLAKLAEIIQVDQVMSASVLRYANSAEVSMGKPAASTVQAAVSRIGSAHIVRLAFAMGVGTHVAKPGMFLDLRRMYWRQAITSAEFCRDAAPMFWVDPNQAYLCGLLHDFGKVIGLSCLEENLRSKAAQVPSPQTSFDLIEAHHENLGQLMALEWNLSEQITEVIRSHHSADAHSDPMVQLVAVSDAVVAGMESQAWFARELLNDVPFLTEAQKDEIYPMLVSLPGRVRALDVHPKVDKASRRRRNTRRPSLPKLHTTLVGPRFTVDHKISVVEGGGGTFQVVEQCQMGLSMVGTGPLVEQSIYKFRLETGADVFDFWGTVALCVHDAKQQRMEIHPIGLERVTAERWQQSLAKAMLLPQGSGAVETDDLRDRVQDGLKVAASRRSSRSTELHTPLQGQTGGRRAGAIAMTPPGEVTATPNRSDSNRVLSKPRYGSFDIEAGWEHP